MSKQQPVSTFARAYCMALLIALACCLTIRFQHEAAMDWSWRCFCAPFYSYAWLAGLEQHWWADDVRQVTQAGGFWPVVSLLCGVACWAVITLVAVVLLLSVVLTALGIDPDAAPRRSSTQRLSGAIEAMAAASRAERAATEAARRQDYTHENVRKAREILKELEDADKTTSSGDGSQGVPGVIGPTGVPGCSREACTNRKPSQYDCQNHPA
jgi:short subunit dehydrogenase-like uncharacterized protein